MTKTTPADAAPRSPTSATRQPVREVGAAALGAVAGALCGITTLVLGVQADIVGVVFHRPEDHPYGGVWCALSLLVGGVAWFASWWVLRRPK